MAWRVPLLVGKGGADGCGSADPDGPERGGAAPLGATGEGPARGLADACRRACGSEGKSRAEAARLSGTERQALHDAVVRSDAEGPAGPHDRPKGHRRPVLDQDDEAAPVQIVLAGPDLARHGRTEGALPSLAGRSAQRRGKSLHPASLSRALRRLGLSERKTRPRPPQADAEAQEAFERGASRRPRAKLPRRIRTGASSCGSKTRPGWARRAARAIAGGSKASARRGDKRFASAHLFAAAEPAPGAEGALVLPTVSTAARSRFLAGLSANLAADAQAALVLDRAGWHGARALVIPDNATLVPRPPCSPEPNPVERLWLPLRERYLSHRLLDDHEAVGDARCHAWTALAQEPGRIQSLTRYPWLPRVRS